MTTLRQLEVKLLSLQSRIAALAWDPTRHARGKSTPRSRGGSFTRLPVFRRGPSGFLERVITPEMRARVETEQKFKAEAPWRVPISTDIDWTRLQRMADRDGFGLGGRIEDIIQQHQTIVKAGGKNVAAVKMVAYVSYPDETGRGELGDRGLSDAVNFTIYRDPIRASRLRFRGSW